MEIHLSNVIEIINPTKEMLNFVKKTYTYINPSYIKKQKMGFYIGKTAKTIKLYEIFMGNIYLPIGCFNDVWGIHPNIDDYRDYSVKKYVDVDSQMVLREYQKPIVKACKHFCNGIIIMPCGTGKSVSMLQTACVLKQKTLWICHRKELLIQAESYIKKYTNATISRISEGNCNYSGDFVFATIQTLYKAINENKIPQDTFGCVIGDEIQHCIISDESVMMFKTCFEYFSAKYKFGCTATLKTSNELWKCIPKIVGDVIYELKKEGSEFVGYYENNPIVRVPLINFQVPARVYMKKTQYKPSDECFDRTGRIIYTKLISALATDYDRNLDILDLCSDINGYTIIVSDRVDQLIFLQEHLDNSVRIDSQLKKSKREELVEDFRKGNYKFLLATYSLIAEGFDVPMLENIILATPIKDSRLVIQSIGRCQRPYKGKEIANVYDFYDNVSILYNAYKERMKIYKKEEWEVIKED